MAPHTSTAEWQSFEARMRRRRAKRLALRADVAADAGCFEDAKVFLEEGRRLAPSLPEFADVEHKLRDTTVASSFNRPVSRRLLPVAAILFLIGLIALTAFSLRHTHPGAPSGASLSPSKLVAADRPEEKPFRLKPEAAGVTNPETPRAAPARLDRTAVLKEAPVPSVLSVRSEIWRTESILRRERPLGVQTLPRPRAGAPSEPSADILIRSALGRYAAARSAQQMSLGACRIDIAGPRARAVCSGWATGVPAIGSNSSRTDTQRWDFELDRTGAGWQIVGARAQKR